MTGGQLSILARNHRIREQKAAYARQYYAAHRAQEIEKKRIKYRARAEHAKKVQERLAELEHCDMAEVLFA